jgi:hypothetical protein
MSTALIGDARRRRTWSSILRGEQRPQILHLRTQVASPRFVVIAVVAVLTGLQNGLRRFPFGFIRTHVVRFAHARPR